MTFRLSKAQIIRLKPNSKSSFAVSMPIHCEATLLAFSCDNLIYIYNRSDFSEKVIGTPDPSSSIILITFAYSIKRDFYIFCIKDNKNIYQISMTDFSVVRIYKEISNSVPHSLTSCIDRLFYLSDANLYSINFLQGQTELISEKINYQEVVSSPNGSAIALFTKGEKEIKILYYPFKEDNFIFSFDSPLVDFQWDCSHYLSAVTACEDMTVKVWLQHQNLSEMYCVGSYTFSEKITTIAFCHDFTDAEFIGRFDNSVGNVAEPSLKRPKAQILVTTTKTMILCEETSANTLSRVMSTSLPYDDQLATICYLFRIYSNGEIEQRFDITFFTKNGLFFHQLELSSNKYTQLTPFQIKFLTNPIKKIINYNQHLVTESDSCFFDWYDDKELNELTYDIGQFKGEINSLQNNFDKKIFDMKSDNNQLLIVLAKNNSGIFDIFKKNHITFNFETDDDITSATIHSQNIFSVCTKSEVICYILEKDSFQIFAKLKANRPIARFLPNSYLLMAVASDDSLSFYSIKYKCFTFISKIATVRINDFVYKEDMNAIIVSTDNMFFFYDFDIELPKIHAIDDDYVFLTSLTLCLFSVLSKRQRKEKVTINDFVIKDDSYILPTCFSSDLPSQFEPYCPLNAPGWEALGDIGRNYIFSYNFARFNDPKLIPFFSIWGFLCRDQHLLIEPLHFTNCREIIASYAPLWVKDNKVLSSFVVEIVNKSYPSEEDLDLYLLLCILVNKFSIASEVAMKHGKKKIAKYLTSDKETNLTKVEKSAFEALKCHRYELASLFFIVLKRNDQALHVIAKEPLLFLLVARLLNEEMKIKEILSMNEFFTSKETSSINRFFTVFKENKKEAVDILINYELPECDLLSLDAHRCEMIKQITNDVPKQILLNLQNVPYFIKKFYMQPSSISVFVEDKTTSSSKKQKKSSNHQNSSFDFDFGGIKQLEIDDFDIEEEEEESKNEIIIKEKSDIKALIDDTNFANCFDKDLFKTNPNVIFTINESFIAFQVNKLFNVQFDERTVKSLTTITRLISDQAMIAAILFSLSFALSKSTMIIPLLESFDFRLENYFDEFEHCEVEVKPPDLLSRFANQSTNVDENDINIVNCLTFNKMAENLSKSINFKNIEILPHYFHHRHRILFKKIKTFYFSNEGLIDDIDPLQLDPIQNLEKMEKVSLHEKWLIAFNSSFSTPFFMDNKFSYTSSYVVKTGIDGPIRGICIDSKNNSKIAIVSESLNTLKISQDELNGKYLGASEDDKYLYFDSPFVSLLQNEEINERTINNDYQFECSWNKGRLLKSFLKTTACDSHPNCEIFVTGEMNGNLKLWRFSSGIPRTIYTTSLIDSCIKTVKFNETGNQLLIVNKEGQIFTNKIDEKKSKKELIPIICWNEKATATWFNEGTQIAVVQPKEAKFCLYDMRVQPITVMANPVKSTSISSMKNSKNEIESSFGPKLKAKSATVLKKMQNIDDTNLLRPVITYDLESSYNQCCPIDIWEHRVAIGNPEGKIQIFDIRNMTPATKKVHQDRVKTLKFHPSGRFLISGGKDNCISINDPNEIYRKSEVLRNVLPPNEFDKKSGITEIAVSRQSIVVGGYSKVLQVWAVENEKSKSFKKSISSAIDLRNIALSNTEDAFSD